MPIHRVDLAAQSSLLDIYATKASQSILPKYRMPEGRTEPRAAYALSGGLCVHDSSGADRGYFSMILS